MAKIRAAPDPHLGYRVSYSYGEFCRAKFTEGRRVGGVLPYDAGGLASGHYGGRHRIRNLTGQTQANYQLVNSITVQNIRRC